MISHFFEAFSIGLTFPALVFCLWVLPHYAGSFNSILRFKLKDAEPHAWIAAGICVGFLGEFVDGLYWGFAWLAHFYQWGIAGDLIAWGVVANIPSREIMVIMAAYGHIRASMQVQPGFSADILNYTTMAAVLMGVIISFILLLTGP